MILMTEINAQKESSIHPLVSPLISSSGLGWKNLVIERHSLLPREVPEVGVRHHIVELASGQHLANGERPDWRGRWTPYSKPPGNICLFTEGVRPAIRSYSQIELTVCGLDPGFATEVAQELDISQLRGRADIRDESAVYLMRLLESAAQPGDSSNRLYVDHLAFASLL